MPSHRPPRSISMMRVVEVFGIDTGVIAYSLVSAKKKCNWHVGPTITGLAP